MIWLLVGFPYGLNMKKKKTQWARCKGHFKDFCGHGTWVPFEPFHYTTLYSGVDWRGLKYHISGTTVKKNTPNVFSQPAAPSGVPSSGSRVKICNFWGIFQFLRYFFGRRLLKVKGLFWGLVPVWAFKKSYCTLRWINGSVVGRKGLKYHDMFWFISALSLLGRGPKLAGVLAIHISTAMNFLRCQRSL